MNPLRNSRPYSSGYDKDGRYYETWIEDGDDEDDYDFRDEISFCSGDEQQHQRTIKIGDSA